MAESVTSLSGENALSEPASPQLAQLKSALKSMWIAGDFGEIAKFTAQAGEDFV